MKGSFFMLVQKYVDMLSGKSVIRQLSEFATARGAEIGYENVFDYSLGNPSVPVPEAYNEVVNTLLNDMIQLHSMVTAHPWAILV